MAGWQAAVAVVASVVGGAAILWPVLVELEVRKCERPKYTVLKTLSATGATVAVGGAKAARGGGAGIVEVRRYAPILVAEAPIDAASMKEAGSVGFRRLAGFIFGKNVAKGGGAGGGGGDGSSGAAAAATTAEKVAMTSPVIMEMSSEKVAMTSPVVLEMKKQGAGEGGAGGGVGGSESGRIRATMAFTMPSKYTKDTLPTPLDDQVKIRELPARTVATLQFRGQVRSEAAYAKPAAALRAALQGAGIAIQGPLEVYQYYPPFTWSFLRINEVAYEVEDAGEGEAVAAVAASK